MVKMAQTPPKEGVDTTLSEQRHIRDHFQSTFIQEKWQLWMKRNLNGNYT